MKKFIYLVLAIIWISLISLPISGLPAIGNLLMITSGVLSVIPPDISDDKEMYISSESYRGQVYIDSLSIPHIYTEDDESADFILGYLHARDRIFQMELIVRMMQGRMSALLGKNAVVLDKYWIQFQFDKKAKNYFKKIEKTKPIISSKLKAYSNGINHYLKHAKSTEKPIEYHLLSADAFQWKAYYSLFVAFYMSNQLNHTSTDLYYQKLLQKLPKDLLDLYYPLQETNIQTTIPEKNNVNALRVSKSLQEEHATISGNERDILNLQLMEIIGSNNWVVGAAKSKSAKAILANDMHLGLSLPGPWFEVHIKTERKHVYGLSIPAAPFVIAGFNEASAWGMTNASWDLIDYFIPNYKDEKSIYYGDELLDIQFTKDTIQVKNGEAIPVDIKSTKVGPIINKDSVEHLTVWIGDREQDVYSAFYHMEVMASFDEFLNALNLFESPAQNFVYADSSGNIGTQSTGKMYIKELGFERGVYSSSNENAISKGYIPYERLPKIYNPEKAFIATANQRQIYNSADYYNWSVFAPSYRGKRIHDLLESNNQLSVNDLKNIQADVYDLSAEILVPLLINYLKEENLHTEIIDHLSNWNFLMKKERFEATIYVDFRLRLFNKIEALLLINTASNSQIKGSVNTFDMKPPSQVMMDVIEKHDMIPVLNGHISRKKLFIETFKETFDDLKNRFGGDYQDWTYVKYHKVRIKHLLNIPALNPEVFGSNGSRYTVNVMGIRGTHGSSQRSVIHMTNPVEAYFNIPGGQSGRPSSKFYTDQLNDWKKVAYHKAQFEEDPKKLNAIIWTKVFGKK